MAERRRGRLPRESCLAPRSPLPAAGAPGPSERPSRGAVSSEPALPCYPRGEPGDACLLSCRCGWARRVLPDVSFFPPLMPVRRPLLPLPLSHLRPAWFGAGLPGAPARGAPGGASWSGRRHEKPPRGFRPGATRRGPSILAPRFPSGSGQRGRTGSAGFLRRRSVWYPAPRARHLPAWGP